MLGFNSHQIEQEIDSKELGTSSEFDTFGSTAAELARRQAAQEIAKRHVVT
jgi:G patch domain-containing protein 1